MSLAKKRKFVEEYIKFGFAFTEKNGIYLPQCVVCRSVFSIDALRRNRLERHLKKNHPALKDKPKEFFYCQTLLVKMDEARCHWSLSSGDI